MRHFATHPIWGLAHICAADQTKFFLHIDRFVPKRHRAAAMTLLRTVIWPQRWGIARARPDGWTIYFKGGWGSGSGAVDHQVALLTRGKERVSIAVLTVGNPDHEYGKATLEGRGAAPASGSRASPVGRLPRRMASHLNVGDPAPDFTLEGTHGTFTLSEHRGGNVVLLFYPGDETLVCTRQFCSYRDRDEEFMALDATIVGISGKDIESKRSFAEHRRLTVPLLADPDHAVAKAYDSYGPIGVKRSTFIVDADGNVAYRKVHQLGLTYESVDDIAAALRDVGARV